VDELVLSPCASALKRSGVGRPASLAHSASTNGPFELSLQSPSTSVSSQLHPSSALAMPCRIASFALSNAIETSASVLSIALPAALMARHGCTLSTGELPHLDQPC
jgi:hypothetical protein